MRKLTRYLLLLLRCYHIWEQTVSECYGWIWEFMGEKYCSWGFTRDSPLFVVEIDAFLTRPANMNSSNYYVLRNESCLSLLRYICRIFAIQRTQDSHIYITCSCSREKGWTMWWTASSKHENSYQEANMLTFEPVQLKSSVLLSLWQSWYCTPCYT